MKQTKADTQSSSPTLERVRLAERRIAEGKYEGALELLRLAQGEEPTNQYIPALVERTIALLYPSAVRRDQAGTSAVQSSGEDSESERRVRRLTLVAKDLFERGSYEMAFQTLMKAFQLSPTSPYVLECQKTLAPAMELLRKRASKGTSQVPVTRASTPADEPERMDWRRRISSVPQKALEPRVDPQEARIEALRKAKELERREREIAMWREASKPPRLHELGLDYKTNRGVLEGDRAPLSS